MCNPILTAMCNPILTVDHVTCDGRRPCQQHFPFLFLFLDIWVVPFLSFCLSLSLKIVNRFTRRATHNNSFFNLPTLRVITFLPSF